MKGIGVEILIGVGWVIGYLGYWFYSNWLADMLYGKKKFWDMLRFAHKRKNSMRALCESLRLAAGAARVTVAYANNGDRIASGLGPIYSSIYLSVSDGEADESYEMSWQQQEVDKAYVDQIVLPIWDGKSIHHVVEKMKSGQLKARFDAYRFKEATFFKLDYRKGKFWYLVMVTRSKAKESQAITDKERDTFNKLNKLLKKA